MVQLVVKEQGTDNTTFLDVGNVSIKGNFSVVEIQDITTRKADFTQPFTLPFTPVNNDFFSHFYEVSISEGTFNPNIKTDAVILDSSSEVFNGYLQLLKVDVKTEIYEVVVFGEISNIVKSLGDITLNKLNLSDYSHVLNETNVVDSWSGNVTYTTSAGQAGDEILYPVIDYGYNFTNESLNSSTIPALSVERLKPAIKLKTVLDNILVTTLKYTINSTFLNSSYFTNQYMTLGGANQQVTLGEGDSFQDSFRAGLSSNQSVSGISNPTILFDDDSSTNAYGDFFDANGNYYTGSPPIVPPYYDVAVSGMHSFTIRLMLTSTTAAGMYIEVKKYNDASFSETVTLGAFPSVGLTQIVTTPEYALTSGDQIYFRIHNIFVTTKVISSASSYVTLNTSPISSVGGTVDLSAWNNIMPENTATEFITSIFSRYNLIVVRDKENPKQLNIEPAFDYFDAGTSKDWSNKLDNNKSITIKPTSEFRKDSINFHDLQDEDWLNVNWLKNKKRIYNNYESYFEGDFGEGELEIKSMFSSFITAPVTGNSTMLIAKHFSWNEGAAEFVSVQPKLFYYSGLKDCNPYKLWSEASGTPTTKTSYPFCGHYSMAGNVVVDTDVDIRFKTQQAQNDTLYVQQPPTTDVYNKCWQKYLNSIYSNDARLLTANFYLTAEDVAAFNYNDKIFIENTYYRVNKISSFAIGKSESVKVELIKYVGESGVLDATPIQGCDLIYAGNNLDGTTDWLNSSYATATPTQECCEANDFVFENDVCYWNTNTEPNPPAPPPITWSPLKPFGTGGSTILLGEEADIIKTSEDSAPEVHLYGTIKRLGKAASNGEVLTWNGTTGSTDWQTPAGGGTPAGSDTQVQFNDGGAFGGDAGLIYNKTTDTLTATNVYSKHLGNNIGTIYDKYLYLTPSDFMQPSSSSTLAMTYTFGGARARVRSASYYLQATFQVPYGMQARKVYLYGNSTNPFTIGVSGVTSGGGGPAGSGYMGTELTLTSPLVGAGGTYWTISFNPSSSLNEVYGCRITLEDV